ncbi:MAG: restriction endonuclease [Ruminococcus sp.]|nr:restriction endonuclease [Ruminococcus sp.]
MENTKYYMVRTHDISDNYINIGWGKVNLVDHNSDFDKLKKQICDIYLNGFIATSAGRTLNQIKRFIDIKPYDIIVVPHGNSIRIATVKNKLYKNNEFGNIIEVEFYKDKNGNIKSVPRNELTEKLQRRLRVRGCTVANYQEFSEEIKKIASTEDYSFKNDIDTQIENKIEQFKHELLNRIQTGETHLQGGGIGLENLIKELLEIDGYGDVKIIPKNKYSGIADADIIAHKNDILIGDTYTLIQVKHHNGITDKHGLEQLISINNGEEYYYDYKVLITSGELADSTRKLAEENDIKYLQGIDLVNWIYDDLNKLSRDTKIKLGISVAPAYYFI